jgi:hypothetical protein
MKYCSLAFAKWHDCAVDDALRGVDIVSFDDERRAPPLDDATTIPFTSRREM